MPDANLGGHLASPTAPGGAGSYPTIGGRKVGIRMCSQEIAGFGLTRRWTGTADPVLLLKPLTRFSVYDFWYVSASSFNLSNIFWRTSSGARPATRWSFSMLVWMCCRSRYFSGFVAFSIASIRVSAYSVS